MLMYICVPTAAKYKFVFCIMCQLGLKQQSQYVKVYKS